MIENVLHKFDSMLERDRYLHLLLLERAGEITGLERQPEFLLHTRFTRNKKSYQAEFYIADFKYFDKEGNKIIEDSKGMRTALYMSKMKRFLDIYRDVIFHEVYRDKKGFKVFVK